MTVEICPTVLGYLEWELIPVNSKSKDFRVPGDDVEFGFSLN